MTPDRAEAFNVLLSSAGRRVALLNILRRTLREMDLPGKVFAADSSKLSSAFHSADRAFQVPSCASAEFVPAMLDICRRHGVRLLIPTIDQELPVYAEHRDRFREIGTVVAISSPEVIALGADKDETHRWLLEMKFPTVDQARVSDVKSDPERWLFPLVVKPRRGSASIGLAVVADLVELDIATRGGEEFVVQTRAPGDEYTIDLLADELGSCVGVVPRRRIEVRSGEVSKGVTTRSDALIELARCICETLPGPYGPLTIQVFMDRSTGETRVIEINPRFGGGFPLSWEAGAAFPRRMIEAILGIEPRTAVDRWKDGLVMLRYDEGVFVESGAAGV
jgi:carbamoyl-phosphate synthase large subunit